jgi:hypothetical protein
VDIVSTLPAGTTVTKVYGNDGLEIDVACTANPTATANCGLFAEGVSGTAQTLSYQGFGPGGTTPISASIAQLGQYTANGAAGITAMPPNGVQMIGADSLSGSAHGGGQVTFSFSSQAGKVVTGTLSVSVGSVYSNTPSPTAVITGTITAD